MPSLGSWLRFAHVLVAFVFVAGLVGRDVTLRRAARSSDISAVTTMVDVAGIFDKLMVIPGSVAVLALGLLTMWAEHLPLFEHGGYWLVVSLVAYVALMALVPMVFIPRGKVFENALTSAQARGAVTPELTAALHDRAVAIARALETTVVAFVVSMMVLKPF